MVEDKNQIIFPYVPYQTFEAFIKHLHETVVTDQINNSMMPTNFSGNSRTGVTSALKALKLIDDNNNTSKELKDLVDAYQSDSWAAKLKEHVLSVYTNIPDDVDLKSVTRKQLEDMFPNMSQQMRDKTIRFFLVANQEAGIEYSPHLKQRKRITRKRSNGTTKKSKKTDKGSQKPPEGKQKPQEENIPKDMIPLPLFPPPRRAYIPSDITDADCEVIEAMMRAYAKQVKDTKK